MDDKLIELIELIQGLAPKIWELAIREVYINIIEIVGFVLLTIGLSIPFAKNFNKNKKIASGFGDGSEYSFFFLMFGGIVLIAMAIMAIISLFELPSMIFNTEFAAIKLLLGQFGGQ